MTTDDLERQAGKSVVKMCANLSLFKYFAAYAVRPGIVRETGHAAGPGLGGRL